MKKYKILLAVALYFIFCSCQKEENTQVEIKEHIYVEKEFVDSWEEECQDGRTYLQLVLDGGYKYRTNQSYLDKFFDDGGKIELFNYSIKKDQMIISGEFIPEYTIRLMHPHLDNIITEGVLMHELGHYFDFKYEFSNSETFKKMYEKYNGDDFDFQFHNNKKVDESEFFAELFMEYTANQDLNIPNDLKNYMDKICKRILENQ